MHIVSDYFVFRRPCTFSSNQVITLSFEALLRFGEITETHFIVQRAIPLLAKTPLGGRKDRPRQAVAI